MKKRILSLVMALVMVLSLAACGTSEEPATAGSTEAGASESKDTAATDTASDEVITVEVWSNNRHDEAYMTSQVEAFNASSDHIQINYTIMTDDWQNSIQLAYQANTAPDVITISSSDGVKLEDYVTAGMFTSLNTFIDGDAEFQKVTEPEAHMYNALNSLDDEIYWVPNGVRSGSRIQWNKDLAAAAGYDEIPSTFPELVQMAKDITDAGNGETYGVGFTSSWGFGRWMEGVGEKSGYTHWGYDYTTGTFDFSSWKPLLEEAAKFMTDGSVLPGSETQGVDNSRAIFAQGSFAIWGNASQEAGVFTEQFPIETFEWGVAELPTMEGEVKGAQPIDPNFGFAMMSSAEDKEAAWEVISFFSSEEFLKGYFEGGYSAPISSYMTDKYDTTKIGRLADFAIQSYEDVYPSVPAVSLEGDDHWVVFWNVVLGNVDVDTAIEDLNKRYNEALDRGLENGTLTRLVIKDFDPLHPSSGTFEYLSE